MDTNSPALPSLFRIERFFAGVEHGDSLHMSLSDSETVLIADLLERASGEETKMWRECNLEYSRSSGHPELLAAIAEAFYPSLDPRSDVLCCVPQEGIHLALRCLIDLISRATEGPWHAICMRPVYQSLAEWLECSSVPLSQWTPYDNDPARWQFDIETLKGLVQANTRLVVLNFPHNPTGYAPTEGEWEELVLWFHERDIIVFSDEMYRYVVVDPQETPLLRPACEVSPTAITLCGMSKSFGMPGLRSGWLATRNNGVLERCRELKDYTTYCGSKPSELLSLIAIRQHDHHTDRIRLIVRRNLELVDSFVERFGHLFRWRRPAMGTLGLMEMLPPLLKKFENATEFTSAVLAECNVVILPAEVMGYKDTYFRIGFGKLSIRKGLEILSNYLQSIDS